MYYYVFDMGLYSSEMEMLFQGFTEVSEDEYYKRVALAASKREQGNGISAPPAMF